MNQTKAELIKGINEFKTKTIQMLDLYELKTGQPWEDENGNTKQNGLPLKLLDKSCMRTPKDILLENYDSFHNLYVSVKKDVLNIAKGIYENSAENYQPINMDEYNELKRAYDQVAAIMIKRGKTVVQCEREHNDTTCAIFLGVQEINTNHSGWDGRYNGSIPFEHKNITYYTQYNLNGTYQDTSDNKLIKLACGGLACNSAIVAPGYITYAVVYNTKMIVDILKNNRNNIRNSGVVSLPQILSVGGKIVAKEFSVMETYTDILKHYPNLKNTLSINDIHPASEAKEIAEEMAYWV